jgi:hypothetical protein
MLCVRSTPFWSVLLRLEAYLTYSLLDSTEGSFIPLDRTVSRICTVPFEKEQLHILKEQFLIMKEQLLIMKEQLLIMKEQLLILEEQLSNLKE